MDLLSNLEFREPWLLLMGLLAIPVMIIGRYAVGRLGYSSLKLLPQASRTWRSRLA